MTPNTNNNLCNVAINYVQQLHIPVTATTLTKSLLSNPYYPTLYSLTSVFNQFGIINNTYEATAENLHELTPPYIAYISHTDAGKDFVLITRMSDTVVQYIAEGKKTVTISKEQFLKIWQNIVFVAERNNAKGEKEYINSLKKEKNKRSKKLALVIGAVGGFALCCVLLFNKNIEHLASNAVLSMALILIIKLLGIATSLLLLTYKIDDSHVLIKNICAVNTNKRTNCNIILNSKAAKIFGIDWSDIGFFYFAATLLFLFIPILSFTTKIAWLATANIIAIPYILFSVYYQWRVVKHWCPLCLTAQAILLMEFVWSMVNFWISNKSLTGFINFDSIAAGAICIIFPIVIWYTIKPILLQAKTAPNYYAAYKRLLYNQTIFNSLLQQQPVAPKGYQDIGISIGNATASHTIIAVSNPYCNACAEAHPMLKEIVEQNNDVKLILMFTTINEDKNKNAVAKHLLAIASKNDATVLENALDDWFALDGKKEYAVFANKYPISETLEQQEAKLEAMNSWCKEAEVMYTPGIFFNGNRLPEIYGIEELKNIVSIID